MKYEDRSGKLVYEFIEALYTLYYGISQNKRYMKDLRNLPYMVNNVLMRYPDSFGQRIQKLCINQFYIIFEAQVNKSRVQEI